MPISQNIDFIVDDYGNLIGASNSKLGATNQRGPDKSFAFVETNPLTGGISLKAGDGKALGPASQKTYLGFTDDFVIDKFVSAGSWSSASTGVPVLAVQDDAKYGSKLQITTDGTTNNHDIVRYVGFSLANGEVLNFAFDFDDAVSVLNVAVSLGGGSFAKSAVLYDASLSAVGGGGIRDFLPSGWRQIGLSSANLVAFTGGAVAADLADVRAIRIRIKTASAVVKTVRLANLKLTRDSGGPRIIWHFDDGRNNQYNNAYPILKAAGYTGTLAVMAGSIGGTYAGLPVVTQAQLNTLYADGWEFVGHHESSFNGQTAAQRQAMIDLFKAWSIANGFVRGRSHWTYVGGWFDAASSAQITDQFLSARRVQGPNGGYGGGGVYEPTQISTAYPGQAVSLASLKAKVDTLVASKNGLLILSFHNILPTYSAEAEDWLTSDFQELVSYALSKGVKSSSYTEEFGSMY